jgi:hypothetical protein
LSNSRSVRGDQWLSKPPAVKRNAAESEPVKEPLTATLSPQEPRKSGAREKETAPQSHVMIRFRQNLL